jgi:hypothetical protein
MDVFEFVPYLQIMNDIPVASIIIAMFVYMAYPEFSESLPRERKSQRAR